MGRGREDTVGEGGGGISVCGEGRERGRGEKMGVCGEEEVLGCVLRNGKGRKDVCVCKWEKASGSVLGEGKYEMEEMGGEDK